MSPRRGFFISIFCIQNNLVSGRHLHPNSRFHKQASQVEQEIRLSVLCQSCDTSKQVI
jgi:hypothetical protein